MSLELIDRAIKEYLRDGEISLSDKDEIFKLAEGFGVSKETVELMIVAEEKSYRERMEAEVKREQSLQKMKMEQAYKENSEMLESKYKNSDWNNGLFNDSAEVWMPWSMIVAGLLGIINAYTHNKSWYAYIGMFIVFALYGFIFYVITYFISSIIKRIPFLDWQRPILFGFSGVVLIIIMYLLIPW